MLIRIEELLKEVEELQQVEDLRYEKNDLNEVKSPEQIHVILNSEQLSEQLKKVNELVEQESDKKRKRKLNSLSNRLEKEGAKLEKYEEQQEVLDWRNSYGQTDEDATKMQR